VLLRRLRKNYRLGIAYFFCNHSEAEQTAKNVIRRLLRQIVEQLPEIPALVRHAYSSYMKSPDRDEPALELSVSLLKSSVEKLCQLKPDGVFILIDAYDEFRNRRYEVEERKSLLTCLSEISTSPGARILISTREHGCLDLNTSFPKAPIAKVRGDLADLASYLDQRLADRSMSPGLKQTVKDTLLNASQEGW